MSLEDGSIELEWQCKIRMALCTDGSQHLHRCGGDVCSAGVSWRQSQWPQVPKGVWGRGMSGVSHLGCPATKWLMDAFLAVSSLLFQSSGLSASKCAHPSCVLFLAILISSYQLPYLWILNRPCYIGIQEFPWTNLVTLEWELKMQEQVKVVILDFDDSY